RRCKSRSRPVARASLGYGIEIELGGDSRRELAGERGMNLAKGGKHGLGPQTEPCRPSGMPGRAGVHEELQVADRGARLLEKGEGFGLGIEGAEYWRLVGLPAARRLVAGQDESRGRPLAFFQ